MKNSDYAENKTSFSFNKFKNKPKYMSFYHIINTETVKIMNKTKSREKN